MTCKKSNGAFSILGPKGHQETKIWTCRTCAKTWKSWPALKKAHEATAGAPCPGKSREHLWSNKRKRLPAVRQLVLKGAWNLTRREVEKLEGRDRQKKNTQQTATSQTNSNTPWWRTTAPGWASPSGHAQHAQPWQEHTQQTRQKASSVATASAVHQT